MQAVQVTFYTTSACHLCETAQAMLEMVAPHATTPLEVEKVDIADSDDLFERYGIRIPVLRRVDSQEELGWPFSPEELLAFVSLA